MKKLLLSFIFCCSVLATAYCQITITREDMPVIGDTIRVSTALAAQTDPMLTGEDYTWDFSNLVPTSQRVISYVNPTSTPFFYQIVFNPSTANLASPVTELDFLSQFQITDAYEFYKATAASYVRPGYAVTISGIPVPMKFNQPELLYNFPLTTNAPKDSSLSVYSIEFPGLGYFSIERKRVNEVDGWGRITTPLGTFDVLRMKSTVYEADSLYLDSLQMGTPINRSIVEYQWIANNMSIPVLSISLEEGVQTITYPDRIENLNNLIVDLGPDMEICEGEEVELSPEVKGGTPPYTYTWSTGETTPSITVSPSETTTYIVGVMDSEMRFMMDEITLNVIPFPQMKLGADTLICAEHSLTFAAPVVYDELRWYVNGTLISQSGTFTIDSTGIGLGEAIIRVEFSLGQCASWDEITVGFQLCNGLSENRPETARAYPNPAGEWLGINLDWQDGDLLFSISSMEGKMIRSGNVSLRNKTAVLNINDLKRGNYFITFQQHKRLAATRFIKE
ncbi:MAG: T9SS type A sorting domain-containing protein [Lentimicrobium sp.]|jgi:hypothetical protein|nr:T9SS type A sorting domain-containing protein [Lentimicrobium sp.]